MYMYVKGLKGNNIGYAKIEARNGICKLTVNVKTDSLKDKKWTIALFHRGNQNENPRNVEIIKIEDINCKEEEYTGNYSTDVNNLFGSGITLNKIAGIIIIGQGSDFIGTEWDDNGIDYKTVTKDKLINTVNEGKVILEEQVKVTKTAKDEEINRWSKETSEEKKDDVLKENIEIKKDKINIENNVLKKDNINNEVSNKTANDDKYRDNIMVDNNTGRYKSETINFNKVNETKIISEQIDSEKDNQKQVNLENNSQPKPYIKRLFDGFPGMYPFEDDEIIDCIKLEPHDIGVFPMDKWPLANNSFLLHGYYTYRHLIFARMRRDNKIRYILGVPGIFRDRERFMAKMFGFSNFKGVRNQPLNVGEFGYWYMYLNV